MFGFSKPSLPSKEVILPEDLKTTYNQMYNHALQLQQEKNHPDACIEFYKAAMAGHAKAMAKYAEYVEHNCVIIKGVYKEGKYKDSAKILGTTAFEWYLRSAELGYVNAMYQVAEFYSEGRYNTKINNEEALKWYIRAYEAGNTKSILHIANAYMSGLGTEKNLKKAFEYYKIGAEMGIKKCIFHLLYCYYNGIGTEENREEVFKCRLKLAELGDAQSQLIVGNCFEKGLDTTLNLEEAFEWYKKAAKKNMPEAIDGIKRVKEKIQENRKIEAQKKADAKYIDDLIKKAENNDADAQYELSLCYKNGNYVEQNVALAEKWLSHAAENENTNAQYELACICKSDWEDYKSAASLYAKAGMKGDMRAVTGLGMLYRRGLGVEKDEKKAFELYTYAAEHGNVSAMVNVAFCFENGYGVDVDYYEACRWYKLAAEHGNKKSNSLYQKASEKYMFHTSLKAAENGTATKEQYVILAHYMMDGIATEKNHEEAIRYAFLAMEKDIPEGQTPYTLPIPEGECRQIFEEALAIERKGNNFRKSFLLFEKAAKLGHPEAYVYKYYSYNTSFDSSLWDEYFEDAKKINHPLAVKHFASILEMAKNKDDKALRWLCSKYEYGDRNIPIEKNPVIEYILHCYMADVYYERSKNYNDVEALYLLQRHLEYLDCPDHKKASIRSNSRTAKSAWGLMDKAYETLEKGGRYADTAISIAREAEATGYAVSDFIRDAKRERSAYKDAKWKQERLHQELNKAIRNKYIQDFNEAFDERERNFNMLFENNYRTESEAALAGERSLSSQMIHEQYRSQKLEEYLKNIDS